VFDVTASARSAPFWACSHVPVIVPNITSTRWPHTAVWHVCHLNSSHALK
jgi:hypothetical protein